MDQELKQKIKNIANQKEWCDEDNIEWFSNIAQKLWNMDIDTIDIQLIMNDIMELMKEERRVIEKSMRDHFKIY